MSTISNIFIKIIIINPNPNPNIFQKVRVKKYRNQHKIKIMSSPMDMSSPDHSNKDMLTHVQKMSGFESLPPELKLVCLLQEKQQASHLKERRQAGDERKQEKKQAFFEREVEGKRARS